MPDVRAKPLDLFSVAFLFLFIYFVAHKGNEEGNQMAIKTAVVRTRIEPKLKREANKVLNKLGLSESEGVRLLLKSLVLHNGLPYELKVPNAKTRQAIEDAENGNTIGPFNSVEELFEELKK